MTNKMIAWISAYKACLVRLYKEIILLKITWLIHREIYVVLLLIKKQKNPKLVKWYAVFLWRL